MTYIPQIQLNYLKNIAKPGKVVIIYGPRRVGKTTLLKHFLDGKSGYLSVTGEDIFVQEFLSSNSIDKLKSFVGNKTMIVIDEAQYIPSIGQNLKLLIDQMPHLTIITTGSSTFDLAKQVGEPLTGRKHVLKVYPIAQLELGAIENVVQTKANLESRLIYGSYPEIITLNDDGMRREYLRDMVSSYLFKDILAFDGIQKSRKLVDLLTLLAFQIGKEVSHNELAARVGMSKTTVDKYLDLLEQVFVIINVRGFSRNLRSEISKTSRYYFNDNGIRNALINNFNLLSRRDDVGMLWENYIWLERIKKLEYTHQFANLYFWRTYDQKEIDYVEERDGHLLGCEMKWGKKINAPQLWLNTYPKASFICVNQDNYLSFIT